LDVEEEEVGAVPADGRDGLGPVRARGGDAEVVARVEEVADVLADERLVLGEDDGQRGGHAAETGGAGASGVRKGRRTVAVRPAAGGLSSVSVAASPWSASSRRRTLRSPIPSHGAAPSGKPGPVSQTRRRRASPS